MIDTTDLTSYYPRYDEYCESKKIKEEHDYSDEYHEEKMIEREFKIMNREIIDSETDYILFDDTLELENYVWKGTKLIPEELLEGE